MLIVTNKQFRYDFKAATNSNFSVSTSYSFLPPAMLRIPSLACQIVRHSRHQTFYAPRTNIPLIICRQPEYPGFIPMSIYHAQTQRSLTLSSVSPVTIAENRHEITFRLKDGTSITQKISPTPKVKLEKLAEALASLVSTPNLNSANTNTAPPSFGTLQWELDPLGDAIHRHVALSSPEECNRVVDTIMVEADKMNHHPHIAREDGDGYSCFTITCTTHSPRGLSARDTRLAAKVDELLAQTGLQVTAPARISNPSLDLEQLQRQISEQRKRMIEINRQKIAEALENCGCDSAKKQ